ncbi:MAG: hypothetical protein RIB46_14395 [Pseudomonadales bacterium]
MAIGCGPVAKEVSVQDVELYFWEVLAELRPSRAVFYYPKEGAGDSEHMGLEAAFQSCASDDCTIGVLGNSDAQTRRMLQAVCARRLRPDMYLDLEVWVFGGFKAEVLVEDLEDCLYPNVVPLDDVHAMR